MSACDRSNQTPSYENLVKRVQARAKGIFAKYCVPLQDAEDLLQQTLLTYLCKRDGIRDAEAWMMGTLRKRCLMYWRSQRRLLYTAVDRAVLEQVTEAEPPSQEKVDLRRDLDRVLDRIPNRCRSLLHLRYRLDCDPPEAAQRLGYSASGIYKITQRCLAALTRQMVTCGLVQERHDA